MNEFQVIGIAAYVVAGIATFKILLPPCKGRPDMILIAFILSIFWFVMVVDIFKGEIPSE